jgi:hypothetical protein|tara:strand:- start:55 stop:408 length:354 start_codon:yes stop_codon:yes gene_type:complete
MDNKCLNDGESGLTVAVATPLATGTPTVVTATLIGVHFQRADEWAPTARSLPGCSVLVHCPDYKPQRGFKRKRSATIDSLGDARWYARYRGPRNCKGARPPSHYTASDLSKDDFWII